MKKDFHHLDKYRTQDFPSPLGATFGCFEIHHAGMHLRIIASCGDEDDEDDVNRDWEHVSARAMDPVFHKERVPNWAEMCFLKDLFWDAEECVVQFHPPKSEYVNTHGCVLHLWKWRRGEFPRPPRILV